MNVDKIRSIFVLELWGLGDSVMMTAFLQKALERMERVAVVTKPVNIELLKPSYPEVDWIPAVVPWTAFKKKYYLHRWDWGHLWEVFQKTRKWEADVAVSARRDPRDHFLMLLTGAKRRVGFKTWASDSLFSTDCLMPPLLKSHRVAHWKSLACYLWGDCKTAEFVPWLDRKIYVGQQPEAGGKKKLVIHCGGGQPTKRWSWKYYAEVIRRIREEFGEVAVTVIPDLDGFGKELIALADQSFFPKNVTELVAALAGHDLFLGNDSGPGHIAAALGLPTASIFSTHFPEIFKPYGERNIAFALGTCPYLPCKDRCRFSEQHCLLDLTPEMVWEGLRKWMTGLGEREKDES